MDYEHFDIVHENVLPGSLIKMKTTGKICDGDQCVHKDHKFNPNKNNDNAHRPMFMAGHLNYDFELLWGTIRLAGMTEELALMESQVYMHSYLGVKCGWLTLDRHIVLAQIPVAPMKTICQLHVLTTCTSFIDRIVAAVIIHSVVPYLVRKYIFKYYI